MKNLFKMREMSSLLFLIVLFAIVGIINPKFLSATSLLGCLNDSVVFTLLACGIAFTIFTGEIDVSISSTLGLSAAVASTMLRDGDSWILAFLFAIIIGAAVGLFNGWGIAALGIPSLIFTLGTNGIVRGLVYVYTGGAWVENLPAWFTKISQAKLIGQLTVYFAVIFIFVLIANYILTRTKKGKYFIAVGDNISGATLVGIPTVKTKTIAYVFSGILSAIAGIVYASRIGFVTPTAGSGYELRAIAACVLGGISLSGGLGSLIGATIGAVIMSSVGRILVFLGFSSDYDNTITGVLLITIVVIDALAQNRVAVKNHRQRLVARTAMDPHKKEADSNAQH